MRIIGNFRSRNPEAVTYRQKMVFKRRLKRWLFIILISAFFTVGFAFLLIVAANRVYLLRSNKNLKAYEWLQEKILRYVPLSRDRGEVKKEEFVKPLYEYQIPVYDGAWFVFEDISFLDKKSQEEVSKFLQRNSVYIIPAGHTFDDVKNFYKRTLSKYRWQFILERPNDDGYLVSGIYFVKENLGLRIYTLTGKDIWYEIIPKEYAESGLKNREIKVFTQEFLVDVASGKNLPPESGFNNLKIPSDYSVQIQQNFITNLNITSVFDEQKQLVVEIIPYKLTEKTEKETVKELTKEYISTKYPQIDSIEITEQEVASRTYKAYKAQFKINGEEYFVLGIKKEDVVYMFDFIKNDHKARLLLTAWLKML